MPTCTYPDCHCNTIAGEYGCEAPPPAPSSRRRPGRVVLVAIVAALAGCAALSLGGCTTAPRYVEQTYDPIALKAANPWLQVDKPGTTPDPRPALAAHKYARFAAAAEARCRYEAAAATVNTRGIFLPAIEEANLRNLCIRAALGG